MISDEDFINAINPVRVSKGMSFTKLSKLSGVSDSQISSFISTHGNIFLSTKARIGIRNALGAANFAELVEMGKQAVEENTFNNEFFCKALQNIIQDKKIVIGSLADEAQVPRNKMSAFIHRRVNISLEACHRIREALGAKNFREIYQMGGVSLPPPDNGIGEVIGSILTQPVYKLGRMKNTDIEHTL